MTVKQQHRNCPARIARGRIELGGKRIKNEQDECDDATLQDRLRVAEVIEGVAVEARAAVKVFLLSDFRPRRIDAERNKGKEEIDDPDAKVLGGRAGKLRTNRADLRSSAIKRRGCDASARSPTRTRSRFGRRDDPPSLLFYVSSIRPENATYLTASLHVGCELMTFR